MGSANGATATQIVKEIKAYAAEPYSGWYAGIAANPREALFTRHGVREQGGSWIYRLATSETVARSAEKTLHAAGFKGGGSGGDEKTKSVYAYKITGSTSED